MRVRFAPDAGFLHIGNACTAVMSCLMARINKADYIIMIGLADRGHSSRESEIPIMDDLQCPGINRTERPDIDKGHPAHRLHEHQVKDQILQQEIMLK